MKNATARQSLKALVLVTVMLVAAHAGASSLSANTSLNQTVPTLTPAYTLPPGPSSTPAPPRSTETPGRPGPSPSAPASTATVPGSTQAPSATPGSPSSGTPAAPGTPSSVPPSAGASQTTPLLACSASVSEVAVQPGEGVEYALLLSNTGSGPATSVTLQTLVAEGVDLISVSGTQGAAEVETHRVTLKLGILEAGQSALAILELRTSLSAQDGQVFVQQGTAYFDGGQATCNTVAFGMRPDHLPATGVEVAEP